MGAKEGRTESGGERMNVSNLRLKEIMDDIGNSFAYKSVTEQGKGRNSFYTSYLFLYDFLWHMEKMPS